MLLYCTFKGCKTCQQNGLFFPLEQSKTTLKVFTSVLQLVSADSKVNFGLDCFFNPYVKETNTHPEGVWIYGEQMRGEDTLLSVSVLLGEHKQIPCTGAGTEVTCIRASLKGTNKSPRSRDLHVRGRDAFACRSAVTHARRQEVSLLCTR